MYFYSFGNKRLLYVKINDLDTPTNYYTDINSDN